MATTFDSLKASAASSPRPKVDWERIELDYRAGIKTLRQMADENGVSHPAITKRAKRDGWSRDLSAKIRARADELVTKELVTKSVTTETKVLERQVVEANGQAAAGIIIGHRTDIPRSRRLTNAMQLELELLTDPKTLALLSDLGEMLRKPDERGIDKLNDLYRTIISLPERVKTMKGLVESLQKLVFLERQAFGLDVDANDGGGDKSFLEAMLNARARAASR